MRVAEFLLAGFWLVAVIRADASEPKDSPVIYDVTTIYRLKEPLPESDISQGFSSQQKIGHPGVMEVHARTNARGLPFRLNNGTVLGPNIAEGFPEWRPSTESFGFVTNNFTLSDIDPSLKTPIVNSEEEILGCKYEIKSSETQFKLKPLFSTKHFKFEFTVTERGRSYGKALLIYLFVKHQSSTNSDIYLIRCEYSSDKSILYKRADGLRTDEANVKETMFNVHENTGTYYNEITSNGFPWSFSVGDKYTFAIEIIDSSLRVTIISPTNATTRVFDWAGLQPSSRLAYFAIGSKHFSGLMTSQIGSNLGLMLNEPTGSVVSPPLPPDMHRVCVSLAYYSSQAVNVDLHLQQGTSLSTLGGTTTKARMSEGWTHQIFEADIPEHPDSETRLVVTASRQADTTVIIKRISGCNLEDPEDVLELPEQVVTNTTGVDVARGSTGYSLSKSAKCFNGGLQVRSTHDVTDDSVSCVCPPGFTGNNCLEGCGANSYGSDCGGVCSGSEGGCRGMVMCKYMMDCDCASGYKGTYCDKNCASGEYGVGCRQSCGHCASDTCDVYTGTCHQGCQTGYAQPYCKQTLSYPSSAPQVSVNNFFSVSVSGNLASLEGHGDPRYYQLQYRKKGSNLWHKEILQSLPIDMGSSAELGNVTGLDQGTDYELRVVLVDQTLDSYQGDLVPSVSFSTPCIVPRKIDYATEAASQMYLKTGRIDDTSITVEWKLPSTNTTWCRLVGYEVLVKVDWRWVTYSVNADINEKRITGLLPGSRYTVKVRAKTLHGLVAFTEPLVVTTHDLVPDHVLNLAVEPVSGRSLKVTWNSPKHLAGTIRHYQVTYKCVRLGSCPEEDCSDSAGQMDVSTTSQLIEGLLPFAVYNISVAGVSGSVGPDSKVQSATSQSVPDVAPSSVSPATTGRTNTSLEVHWAPPGNCRMINGYLAGYRYELLPAGQATPLFVGSTPDCSASFNNLTPHAEYVVRVFVVSGAGWSISNPLDITTRTRAATAEGVQDLVVYKRGRRLLGLRWSPPRMSYGSLQSFTVTHSAVGGAEKPVGVTVKPTPCPAWPRLFCLTLKNLKQDTDYTISVQARNDEVNEDGDEGTIIASTRESAPGAPSFLRVPTKTSDSLTLEWGLPELINGQLRSFLVNIEETDSLNSTDCCQYFPIREVIVTSERLVYESKLTGLRPSSTYEVSVSAKTVAMGPALTLTVHTRPPSPVLVQAPKIEGEVVVGGPLRVRLEAASDYQEDQVSGYLLLLKDSTSVESSSLRDEWLAQQLTEALNGGFSLAAEFPKGKLPEGGIVELLPGGLIKEDGVFGAIGLTELRPGTEYQLVWVLVLEYCDTLSEGHIVSEPFTVE